MIVFDERCGCTYDDAEVSTVHPHDRLPPMAVTIFCHGEERTARTFAELNAIHAEASHVDRHPTHG